MILLSGPVAAFRFHSAIRVGGGPKWGRFVILRFGSQATQILGKDSTKSVMVTPLFVCATNASKN